MIFNALIYNLEDYFNKYMEYTGYKDKFLNTEDGEKISEEVYLETLHNILEELSKLNISGDFLKKEIRKYILLIK